MSENNKTSNFLMRPLIVKLFMIVSVVLVYAALLYAGFLTFIPPDLKFKVSDIITSTGTNIVPDTVLSNLGWYSVTAADANSNWLQSNVLNLSTAGIVGICLIAIALVFNLFVYFWYKKTNFSIGKDKSKILSVYTAPILGMLFAAAVGLAAYPDYGSSISQMINYPSYLFQKGQLFDLGSIGSAANVDINQILQTGYTFTTTGWILFAIEIVILLAAVFGLVFFLFRIISKSKWEKKSE